MKKLLLSALALCAAVASQASEPTQLWSKSVDNTFDEKETIYNAPVAVDAEGNVVATGAYNQDVTVNGVACSAVGSSAFLTKYDVTGAAKWTVAFTGAVSVSAVTTDTEGNIYVAGTLADEVEFGTTSGDAQTVTGMVFEGTPSASKNASFLAKYTADGALAGSVKVITAGMTAALKEKYDAKAEDYSYTDGNIFFSIKNIQVNGDQILISALYAGEASYEGASFACHYISYMGSTLKETKTGVVFTTDKSFANAAVVATMAQGLENGASSENDSPVTEVYAAAKGTEVVCAFAVYGDMKFYNKNFSENKSYKTTTSYDTVDGHAIFIGVVKDGTYAGCAEINSGLTFVSFDTVKYISFEEGKYVVAGTYLGDLDEATYSNPHYLFTADVDAASFAATVSKAEYSFDAWSFSANPATVVKEGDNYRFTIVMTGDPTFGANKILSGSTLAEATVEPGAFYTAAAGDYEAFANISPAGITYMLFKGEGAGIGNIVAGDENAPAEYYNLQGIRVAQPQNGIFIRRIGNKSEKIVF